MAVRALGPATLAVHQALRSALTGPGPYAVACSGGPDSLALAAGAARFEVVGPALIVDHGLQPDSADVAATTAAQLQRLGLAVRVCPVRVDPDDPAGPEAAARTARYAALAAAADDADAPGVLLGHTRDDQAETVLLGLARGSGTRSLAGMTPVNGRWVRPLLDLTRETTRQACVEQDLVAWTDPQNADPRFARVRVRHRVLPTLATELGPGVAAALARTATLARIDADHLDALAAAADPGTDTLDVTELTTRPDAIRGRVLRRWLARRGAVDVGHDHVVAVEALVTAWRGQTGVDLPGVRVSREQGRLVARPQ